jgi:hypothetical protein
MLAEKIRQTLIDAGLTEYHHKQNGKYLISVPGFIIGADHMRECLVSYQSDAPVPASQTDKILAAYQLTLTMAGYHCRPAQQTLALVVREPQQHNRPATITPVNSYHRPPVETYRRQLIVETAGMFRAAIRTHAAKKQYLTAEGRLDIKRKMRSLVDAPVEQLEFWRQRVG